VTEILSEGGRSTGVGVSTIGREYVELAELSLIPRHPSLFSPHVSNLFEFLTTRTCVAEADRERVNARE